MDNGANFEKTTTSEFANTPFVIWLSSDQDNADAQYNNFTVASKMLEEGSSVTELHERVVLLSKLFQEKLTSLISIYTI